MNKKVVISIFIFCGILGFLKFGRSIYMPIVKSVMVKETVLSISAKIESDVKRRLGANIEKSGLDYWPKQLVLLGLKEERRLEVYAIKDTGYMLLKSYPFTAFSGKLGPKLQKGDGQIPEGVYKIAHLNPNSSFYLSMKIDFPNTFDIQKSSFENKNDLGSDIFIHGKSSSIGCIAIGDEAIEELFILVYHALNSGVKVIISPHDFRVKKDIPHIDEITWGAELYDIIKTEISKLSQPVATDNL